VGTNPRGLSPHTSQPLQTPKFRGGLPLPTAMLLAAVDLSFVHFCFCVTYPTQSRCCLSLRQKLVGLCPHEKHPVGSWVDRMLMHCSYMPPILLANCAKRRLNDGFGREDCDTPQPDHPSPTTTPDTSLLSSPLLPSSTTTPTTLPCTDTDEEEEDISDPDTDEISLKRILADGCICESLPPEKTVDVSWQVKRKKNDWLVGRKIKKKTRTVRVVSYEKHPTRPLDLIVKRTRVYRRIITRRDTLATLAGASATATT